MAAIALTPQSRRLERHGPRNKRRRNGHGLLDDRFHFDHHRHQPIPNAFIRYDRKKKVIALEIDFYSARDGWKIDSDPERWEDEKLHGTCPATRSGYREAYRVARALLGDVPVIIGGASYLPISYYGRSA